MSKLDEREKIQHESFGTLSVSKVFRGGTTHLYGSSIEHRNTIRIRLNGSHMQRHLSQDWYHTGPVFFEVEMSMTQWAEFVASMGDGTGIPCTIRYMQGKQMEDCPYMSKRQMFDTEFKSTMDEATANITAAIEAAEDILNNKTVSKADRLSILKHLEKAKNSLLDSIPFIKRQFTEQMDRTVMEAKGEYDAHVLRKMVDAAHAFLSGKSADESHQIEEQD